MSTKNVLITEDDKSWRGRLSRGFSRAGVDPDVASNYDEAVKFANSKSYELCVLDSLEGDCFPLRDELLSLNPNSRVVIFTGNIATYSGASSKGIEAYRKPGELNKLFKLVK